MYRKRGFERLKKKKKKGRKRRREEEKKKYKDTKKYIKKKQKIIKHGKTTGRKIVLQIRPAKTCK